MDFDKREMFLLSLRLTLKLEIPILTPTFTIVEDSFTKGEDIIMKPPKSLPYRTYVI